MIIHSVKMAPPQGRTTAWSSQSSQWSMILGQSTLPLPRCETVESGCYFHPEPHTKWWCRQPLGVSCQALQITNAPVGDIQLNSPVVRVACNFYDKLCVADMLKVLMNRGGRANLFLLREAHHFHNGHGPILGDEGQEHFCFMGHAVRKAIAVQFKWGHLSHLSIKAA